MRKPIIGISGSIIVDQGGMFPGYRRSYLNEDYISSVLDSGGTPVIIPVIKDIKSIDAIVDTIDGLILSGGHDISPRFYGEEPKIKLGEIFPDRDQFEFELLKKAKEKKIPILGICRGCQIINVFHGGTIYQDLSYRTGDTIKHWQSHSPEMVTHTVELEMNSLLNNIWNVNEIWVNSFHHQTIKEVPDNFAVSARSKDGVIEAIESLDDSFLIGIQWHPEMLSNSTKEMAKLFETLISKASEGEKKQCLKV